MGSETNTTSPARLDMTWLLKPVVLCLAVSSGRSNSGRWTLGFLKHELREHFAWFPEPQNSTWPVIQRISDSPQIIHAARDFCPFREVFADQPVGVLIGPPLPRGMRMREIDRQVSGPGEGRVPGHLGALGPGERPAQVRGQILDRIEQRVLDRVRVVAVRQRDRAQEP